MDKTNTLSKLLASFYPKSDAEWSGTKQCQADHEAIAGPSERTIRFLIQYAASFEQISSKSVGRVFFTTYFKMFFFIRY